MLAILSFSSMSHSIEMTPEILKIKESGVLKIGVRTNAPPFSNYNNGNPQGYVVELCNQIHQNLQKELNSKLQVKYLPVTSANRFEMIESGDIDIECGTTTVTKARRDKADFSFNTFVTTTNFVTLAANKNLSPKDFYNPLIVEKKKVALMKGTSHDEWIKTWTYGQALNIVYVENVSEGIQKVLSGEALLFIQDKILIENSLMSSNIPKKNFYFSEHTISLEPYSIMVKKGNKGLLNYVNSELRTYYKSGFAKNNLDKYFTPYNISISPLNNDIFRNPSLENAVP